VRARTEAVCDDQVVQSPFSDPACTPFICDEFCG